MLNEHSLPQAVDDCLLYQRSKSISIIHTFLPGALSEGFLADTAERRPVRCAVLPLYFVPLYHCTLPTGFQLSTSNLHPNSPPTNISLDHHSLANHHAGFPPHPVAPPQTSDAHPDRGLPSAVIPSTWQNSCERRSSVRRSRSPRGTSGRGVPARHSCSHVRNTSARWRAKG